VTLACEAPGHRDDRLRARMLVGGEVYLDKHCGEGVEILDPPQGEGVTVFVEARRRGDQTDSMRGAVRAGPDGFEAVYLLNLELYRSQWFATEALARAELAMHQDALAAAGWTPVPFRGVV
jgi:hypothetical protein